MSEETPLTAPLYERERDYEVAYAIAKSLHRMGLLSESELVKIDAILAETFSAVIGKIRRKSA